MIQFNSHISVGLKLRLLVVGITLLLSINRTNAQQANITLTGANTTGTYNATHQITLGVGFGTLAGGTFGATIVAPNLFSCGVLGQPSSSQNYVQTLTPRQPFTDPTVLMSQTSCAVNQTIQYIDGLGRSLQTVQVNGNPSGTKDVIAPQAYDQFGREVTKYLPYTDGTATAGSYRPTALFDASGVYVNSAQYGFYHPSTSQNYSAINTPSASTAFEPSPLNRVIEQGAPGNDWQLAGTTNPDGTTAGGHTNKIIYASNDGTTYWAKQFAVNIDPTTGIRSLVDQGSYTANVLYVTVSQDENWNASQTDLRLNTTEEYKDKEGHVVLKRTYNSVSGATQVLSTYYVYDDFNELAFVLPPGANADASTPASPTVSQAVLNNLCYQYGYDERQRLTQKRLPGKGWEYMVYNTLDQVVATQDANQQANGRWEITKYDALGRVVVTGIWNSSNTPQAMQTAVTAQTANWENRDNTQTYGYTLTNTYPTNLDNVLMVNYYDDYNFPAAFTPPAYAANTQITLPAAMPSSQSQMTRGLLTGSLTAVLNGTSNNTSMANMLWKVNYYDDKGRVIQADEQHYLGGSINPGNYDQISNGYDFTNAIVQSIRIHNNATGASPVLTTIANTYVYDHMGRKRQTFEQINGGTNVLLSQTDFNEIGQGLTKHLHSTDNGISFLQDIGYSYNERGWLSTEGTSASGTATNLFSLALKYNLPDATIVPQWNGNIAEMQYNGQNSGFKQFGYTYDALNRLTIAASTGGTLDEAIGYDLMGNITSLTRGGSNAASLSYAYQDANSNYTNQLQAVTNGGSAFRTYAYDPNGNATSDGGSKGISYNMLNLPQSVTQGGTPLANYVYEASGTKIRNTGSDGTWDYIDGIVYHNGTIDFISTEEGRAVPNGGSYSYQYNLKDHLGDVRVSFDQNSGTGLAEVLQEDEYYSFGLRHGLYDNSNNNRYLYNGKERQTDLTDQYDYGARFYDPVIARWTSVDPKAELDRRWSPYIYGFGDPLKFTDPDGMWPDCKTCDLLIGYAAAVVDNNTGGLLPIRQLAGKIISDPASFNRGQDGGDIASVIQGAAEVNGGSATASTALAVTAGSGGLTAEVSLPAAAIGGAVALHGAVTGAHGAYSLASQKGRLPEPEKTNEHHSDPKFMGGDPKQKTTTMPESEHQQLHKDLNDHLVNQTDGNGNHMRPQKGNSGANIQRNFTQAERNKAMVDFYLNQGKKFLNAASDYFTQHPQ